MSSSLVTIGVSTFNRREYLRLALNSLTAQTYPNCEIVVVDDGSSDDTGAMVAESFPQARYFYQANAGDAAAKNRAAAEARGEYLVFCDSDDLFLPDTVERLIGALRGAEACSYGPYRAIDGDGRPLPTRGKVAHYPSGVITSDLLRHIVVCNCGLLMPTALFRRLGGFDTALPVAYDYKFILELSLAAPFDAVQEPVFLRRRHGANLSRSSYAKMRVMLEVVESFARSHPESCDPAVLRRRRGELCRRLHREAVREHLRPEARFYAREAFRLAPGVKTGFRYLAESLKRR